MPEGFFSGKAAQILGVSRDALQQAILYHGAPDASRRHGRKRLFSMEDIQRFQEWQRRRAAK